MLSYRIVLLALLLSTPVLSAPIDEFRISDIERQLNDLQATVREQARLIAQLQQQSANRVSVTTSSKQVTDSASHNTSTSEARWLNYSRWQQLKPGMSEWQVIELLGAPTQMRSGDTEQDRQLWYAIEIGHSGFLSGKVTMTQGKLTAVELPALR